MKINIEKIKKLVKAKNIVLVIKKELKSYFDSPTAYVVLLIFLLLWELLFFRSAFLVGTASITAMFGLLPWLLLFVCPAITMGSISQEKSEGTLELLLTHSLKNAEVILGKFLAALGFVTIGMLMTVPIAITFSVFGDLDWGSTIAQYLAGFSLAGLFIALGIFISSIFRNQISSLLIAIVSNFLLLIAGSEIITIGLPFSISTFFEKISASSHFYSMTRGVIDLRDVWYFLSMVMIFLSFSLLLLLRQRYGKGKFRIHKYRIGVIVFLVIATVINLGGNRIPGRIDLTQERLYTLSSSTKQILSNLNETAIITVFNSELPSQFQPILRDTKNILQDYKTRGHGKIIVLYKDPTKNTETLQETLSSGVQEMQFNIVENEEFKIKKGFFGLTFVMNGEVEVMPYIETTRGLEYQLTSYIKKLGTTEKKTITFLAGHGEKTPTQGMAFLAKELESQFNIIESDGNPLSTSTDVLVIAGVTETIDDTTKNNIKNYIENGNPALFLLDTIKINLDGLTVEENPNSFADFLLEYGIEIQNNVVYDIQSKETVRFGGGFMSFLLPYPFWPILEITDDTSPISSKIKSVITPWASSINLNQEKLAENNIETTVLFGTTESGGTQNENFDLNPEQRFVSNNLSTKTMIVSIKRDKTETNNGIRMITAGNSGFLSDNLLQDTPNNLAFGMEAISFLAQEDSLANIQLKQRTQPKLQFENNNQVTKVKYGNIAFIVLLPIGFGLYRLLKRRQLRKYTYSSRN